MRTLFFLAAVCLVFDGGRLRADEEEAKIIKEAIKAHGGEKNLAKFMKCEFEKKGTATIGGQTYLFTSTFTAGTGKFEEFTRFYVENPFGKPILFMSGRNKYVRLKNACRPA